MFMYITFVSSVINFNYSGQQLFSNKWTVGYKIQETLTNIKLRSKNENFKIGKNGLAYWSRAFEEEAGVL